MVDAVRTTDTDPEALARSMVGRSVDLSTRWARSAPGEPVLKIAGLQLDAVDGRGRLQDIDLEVRAGEIVGVAGVSGNGQRELAETIAGLRRPDGGSVQVLHRDITGVGPAQSRMAGLAYAPEDRLGTGLAPSLSVAENLQLTRSLPFLLDRRRAVTHATEVIERFDVRTTGPGAAVGTMSGGNAQKVLLARELDVSDGLTRAIVVAAPTRGLDVGATEFRRDLLDARRADGFAILLISEQRAVAADLDRRTVGHPGDRPGAVLPGPGRVRHVGRDRDGALYLTRTRTGLALRSVGESPATADAVGIRVAAMRYAHVIIGGGLAGAGGAYVILARVPAWAQAGTTNGIGWIAIALVVFASWRSLRALAGAYLFGAALRANFALQAAGVTSIPAEFLAMLPYVLTIVVLMVLSTTTAARRRQGAPAALGAPFVRDER